MLAGARILEVHMRLADSPEPNPDYGVAHDPKQLAEYVQRVRSAEAELGSGVKRLMPAEETMARYRTVTT